MMQSLSGKKMRDKAVPPEPERPSQPERQGPRSAALRGRAAGGRDEAAAFLAFLLSRLRETVNQSRPRSQLLGLCVAPARADVATLVSSFDARQLITGVAASSFELAGRCDVHDFVCRFDCARGRGRVLFGRIRLGAEGWRVVSLQQLPSGPRACRPQPRTALKSSPTTV